MRFKVHYSPKSNPCATTIRPDHGRFLDAGSRADLRNVVDRVLQSSSPARYNRCRRPGPARRACGASGVTSPRAPAGAAARGQSRRGHVTAVRTRRSRRVVAPARPCWRRVGALLHAGDAARLDPRSACSPNACRRDAAGARPRSDRARSPRSRARADRGIALVPWSDAAYPAALAAIVDPPPALWVRGNLAALSRPGRRHRRLARGIAVRADASPSGSPPISRRAASSSSAAWRAASIRRRIAARSRRAARRSPCSARAPTSSIPPSTRDLARDIEPDGAVLSELVPGHAAAQAVLSAAQSHHQRAVARRAGRRSRGEERVAHHGAVRARAGTRRAGGARATS